MTKFNVIVTSVSHVAVEADTLTEACDRAEVHFMDLFGGEVNELSCQVVSPSDDPFHSPDEILDARSQIDPKQAEPSRVIAVYHRESHRDALVEFVGVYSTEAKAKEAIRLHRERSVTTEGRKNPEFEYLWGYGSIDDMNSWL